MEPAAIPSTERRLVSVLFADLVGFTSLSESRDPEEVRELLSRYFDTSRQLITRYGGTVEKFIGDAVMAVWGTPVATEDDAERAVRAALDLVGAVATLGQEVGSPELRARAAVLTGEAAVNVGAVGQGMVAGDLVNSASRVQAIAPPGGVLVGEVTKRATDSTIVYEDAGTHALKGKTEPIPLWSALRVVAGARGARKSVGLEAPFVGRDRELRLTKELFHASAEEGRAHLVSVVGIAGIGKSRLAWEFDKYTDGLADTIFWHRGRCLSYGEGVTYWALGEMVKMRARIAEEEDPASAVTKLRTVIEENVSNPEERSWIEPRLAHLLGLEDRTATDRDELFSAWRLFFERLSERYPTVLVFEDMQWADASLLDFIEYLLDWSHNHPLFIMTLARPELTERSANWGAIRRNFTSLYLEPLATEAMLELLSGLVPGLPEELRDRILERAEGVPLYAVETVRMLLDRGLLVQEGIAYRPRGPVETLEVPETLHALIAARLDGLAQEERRLLQDGAVLGKTFTKPALSALTRMSDSDLEPILGALVRKEVLSIQADPRSPEHGQYGFLQDLVRHVAYEMLSKKERKTRHLAAAAHLESTWGSDEDEIVEVVASHYIRAFEAAPEAEDAPEIRAKAREMLERAGERAASLAASGEARHYFEQAAGLADQPVNRAELLERAGQMAWAGGETEEAAGNFEQAMALFEDDGQTHSSARVSARLAEVDWSAGRQDVAIERMEAGFKVLAADDPDEDLAMLAAQLGRYYTLSDELDRATAPLEVALEIAEKLDLPAIISQALNSKGIVALYRGRLHEGLAFFKHALEVGVENDIPVAALRAYNNVAETLGRKDRYQEAVDYHRRGVDLARKVGNRFWELSLIGERSYGLWQLGLWDEALEETSQVPETDMAEFAIASWVSSLPQIYVARGDVASAERLLSFFKRYETSADPQDRSVYAAAQAAVLLTEGSFDKALGLGLAAFTARDQLGTGAQGVKDGFVQAGEAASAIGDLTALESLVSVVDGLPPGHVTPFLRGHCLRFRARLLQAKGADGVEACFKETAGLFREHSMRFWLAVTLLEYSEWLVTLGRTDEAGTLLAEARDAFARLQAALWSKRAAPHPRP